MRSTPRAGVSTVLDRAMLVLGAFGDGDGELRLSELVDHTGLAKPTVYRLAGQLEAAGLLERGTANAGYRLGLRLFELGQLAPRQRAVHEIALPYLHELPRSPRDTVQLAVLDGGEVVFLARLIAIDGPSLPFRVGGRAPAHSTALGKALLAHASVAEVQRVLGRGLRRRTPYTICAPGQLLRELAMIRRTGLAFEQEQTSVGVCCVAAPILDRRGRAVAALSVSGPVHQIDLSRIGRGVRTAATAIGCELRQPAQSAE
jgi:IclR family transcriptional regulator, acetate operon repressor